MDVLSWLVTITLCTAAGYSIAGKWSGPRLRGEWIAWIVVLALAGSVGRNSALISIYGFAVYFNAILQGLILGIIVRFLMRSAPRVL